MACRRYPLCRRAARRRRRPSPYDAPRRTRFASRSSIDRRPGNGPRRRATPQGFSPRGARDSDGRVPGPAAAGNLGPARPFDGASPAPDGLLVRAALILLAVVALVGIGTAEALISTDQLSQLPGRGRPTLSAGGTALTVIGIALSAVVYAALGLLVARSRARESSVLPIGMAVGAGAGLSEWGPGRLWARRSADGDARCLRRSFGGRQHRRGGEPYLAELPGWSSSAEAATSELIRSSTPSFARATNPATISGSKRSPAPASIACSPASADQASLYGRFEVSASNTSAIETILAASEISSPFFPSG